MNDFIKDVKYIKEDKKYYKIEPERTVKTRISKKEYIIGLENMVLKQQTEKGFLERKLEDVEENNRKKEELLSVVSEIMKSDRFLEFDISIQPKLIDVATWGQKSDIVNISSTYTIVVEVPAKE